jgi:hypothetical protein
MNGDITIREKNVLSIRDFVLLVRLENLGLATVAKSQKSQKAWRY